MYRSYCARRIDPCLVKIVSSINKAWKGTYKTVASCCGHGKYTPTVIVYDLKRDRYFDWFTKKEVSHKGKTKKMFYTKDGKGKGDHYFIPGVSVLLSETPVPPPDSDDR